MKATAPLQPCELPVCTNTFQPAARGSVRKFCDEHRTANARLRALKGADLPPAPPDDEEVRELRASLQRSQAALFRAKSKSEDLVDAVYKAAYDAALVLGPVPMPPAPKGLSHRADKDETALLHTTDWQLGKLTDTYNMDKCEQRIRLLGEKVAMLTEIQRTAHPVSRIHVMFGGDMVENVDIFPGQAFEIEETLFGQLFRGVKITVELIEFLLTIFEEVEVTGEPGNHGRFGRRGQFPARDNADRMLYEIARRHFTGNPRVTWHETGEGWHQMVQIGEYRAMLIHGDEIKSFGGNTPAFGLLRKGTAWSSGVVPGGFEDIFFGHFHTHMSLTLPNGGHMYGTGSTESDNAYAAEFVAAKGKPSQRLMFVDPRKGRITAEYQVYLDDSEIA